MLQIRHITAFRELEPSRLGGRSLCIECGAGERCDRVALKVSKPGRLESCDIRKAPLAPFFLVIAAVSGIPFLFTNNASTAEPKRVLLVPSFSDAAPPLTIHSFE